MRGPAGIGIRLAGEGETRSVLIGSPAPDRKPGCVEGTVPIGMESRASGLRAGDADVQPAIVPPLSRAVKSGRGMKRLMNVADQVDQPDEVVGFQLVAGPRIGEHAGEGADLGLGIGAGRLPERGTVRRERDVLIVPVAVLGAIVIARVARGGRASRRHVAVVSVIAVLDSSGQPEAWMNATRSRSAAAMPRVQRA